MSKYKNLTLYEQVVLRPGMYLGTTNINESKMFVSDDTDVFHKAKHLESPAASQCFREVITNASDQCVISKSKDASIWINFDEKTGRISVRNDTTCVEVQDVVTADGRTMKSPQMIFGVLLSSSNYDDEDVDQTPTGGQNGYGVKLVNIMSNYFSIETCDTDNKVHYKQEWTNRMSGVSEPEIKRTTRSSKKFTEVTFDLALDVFGMELGSVNFSDFMEICKGMAIYTAAYIPGTVYWNGEPLPIQSMGDIITHLCPGSKRVQTTLRGKDDLPWDISISVQQTGPFNFITMVNGIALSSGNHITYFKKEIVDAFEQKYIDLCHKETKIKKDEIKDAFKPNKITKHLTIFHSGKLITPGYSGQRKDVLKEKPADLRRYKFSKRFYDSLWAILEPILIEQISQDMKKSGGKKYKTKKVNKADKYVAAKWAGGKNRGQCWLFLPEGDSAMTVVESIIDSKQSPINRNTHGAFSVQGVIPNVRKETKRLNDGSLIPSSKLLKSARLQSLFGVLGLEWGKKHTEASLKKLPYRGVIIATDQDEDGKGNIKSSIANMFQTLWPELIKLGYVTFIITPIIRAYPNSVRAQIIEFKSEPEFKTWSEDNDTGKYEIIYYKGLGSHSPKEQDRMASQYDDLIITFRGDSRCEAYCEIYFGKESDPRKVILANPPIGDESEFYKRGRVALTNHLHTDTRAYQQYNIRRHIPHYMDGLTPSTRKVGFGSMLKWKTGNKRCKVFELSGDIISRVGYHHGDASLNGTITRMAQCFIGARNLPMLRALSSFGTRKKGGTDAGSPRYIYTCLNKKLTETLHPSADWNIINYEFSDGDRNEPVFMVPIVPTSILESYSSPGTGWACTTIARDYFDVSEHLKKCIEAGDTIERKEDFRLNDWNFTHTIEHNNSVGSYERTGPDTIKITEMPMGKSNLALTSNGDKGKGIDFKEIDLEKKLPKFGCLLHHPLVVKYSDTSTGGIGETNIDIEFQPGMIDKIMEDYLEKNPKKYKYDPIIRYLSLHKTLKPNLNYVNDHGSVIEFNSYIDIFNKWFHVRKRIYGLRIDRELELLRLRIAVLIIQLRYATHRNDYNIGKISKAKQVKILEDNDYETINKTVLDNPGFIPTSELRAKIFESKKASHDYLLRMNALDCNNEGIKKMSDKLAEMEARLKMLSDRMENELFKGATVWLEELNTLDEIVTTARATGWESWDKKRR